ncbi:MAG: hypothetical protein DRI71_04025, partial [Bacteroidetes bacterium]
MNLSVTGVAQDLAVSNIDDTLKKNANVVIRNSITEFNVINPGKAIETYHVELTILNPSGKREATQLVGFSDLEKVLEVNGEIYDRNGVRVKKIKNADIADVSATGSSMYTDNRVKVLDFTYPSYPYSIIFNYKVMHEGLMFYPNWSPQDSYKSSVEKAVFRVRVPENMGLNYYEHLVDGDEKVEGKEIVYTWKVENVFGYKPEPYGPPGRDLKPFVMITPKHFEMEGYEGSMSSWESIGKYDLDLIEGRGELPKEAILKIEKELSGITDKREKARRIYEFVQNTTRYVSVQLGIGGWQPFDAQYVFENGYGDCKALTNYTAALMNHAGIESIYTSVLAGRGATDIVVDFPNARFNHVFLAVPFEKDTVWLECTSQSTPFGYLGTFTSDRHVLMATRDGGKLVKTPSYSKEDNLQFRVAEVRLTKEGNATAVIRTEYSGIQYENVNGQLHKSPSDQKKWLSKKIDLDKTTITDFSYKLQSDMIPKITEELKVSSAGFGSITGNRIFFEANPLNQISSIPKKIADRKSDVYIKQAYTDIDSIHYVLPEGYHVEHLPDTKVIDTPFASY